MNVIAFSKDVQTPSSPEDIDEGCYREQLLTMTVPNKKHLINFIDKLQTGSDTYYIPALEEAFKLFKQTPVREKQTGW